MLTQRRSRNDVVISLGIALAILMTIGPAVVLNYIGALR
jgi:hypothetical protein